MLLACLRISAIRAHRPTKCEDRSLPGYNHLFCSSGHNDVELYDFFLFRLSFNTAWSLRQILPTQNSRTCACW